MPYVYFFLKSKDTSNNDVIDFRDGKNDTALIGYAKKQPPENLDNQLFEFDFSGDPTYFFLTNKLGTVIDDAGSTGVNLVAYARNVPTTDNQIWSLEALDANGEYYYISNKAHPEKVITLGKVRTNPKEKDLTLSPKQTPPLDTQLWSIVPTTHP